MLMKPADQMGHIVDCHLHVIGNGNDFPFAASRSYEPPLSSIEELLSLHDTLGVDRGVLVQPSVYGSDNGLLLQTLRNHRDRFRGVAVVETVPDDGRIASLFEGGIVGLRLNLMHGGGPSLAQLANYAALCREVGFHLQIYTDGRLIPQLSVTLSKAEVPIVFDHFGGITPEMAVRGHPVIETMVSLLAEGAWVKLSAPYRVSAQRSGFTDLIPLGKRLFAAAPERCVWGSDWPHVATDKSVPSTGLFDIIEAISVEPEDLEAVLSLNAERLYGFASGKGSRVTANAWFG